MAYSSGNLSLLTGAPGDLVYKYDSGSDTMATVITAGYFNNADDNLNLVVDDRIMVDATDGNMWVKVSAVSSGSVTVQFAGGDLPINSVAGATSGALSMGYTEIASATGSAFTLPTPYAGAHVIMNYTGSATNSRSFITDATAVTLNNTGNRTITTNYEGENFHLVGGSTTRWHIYSMSNPASTGTALT